jgi:U3 small nucleolar RNA-associated protein 25
MKSKSSSKGKVKKKEKGGRKAREKRKLDKQWGEVDREDDDGYSKVPKSRRKISDKRTRGEDNAVVAKSYNADTFGDAALSSSEEEEEEDDDEHGGRGKLASLLSNIKKSKQSIHEDDSFDFFSKYADPATGEEETKEDEYDLNEDAIQEQKEDELKEKAFANNDKKKAKGPAPYAVRFEQDHAASQLLPASAIYRHPAANDNIDIDIVAHGDLMCDCLNNSVANDQSLSKREKDMAATTEKALQPSLVMDECGSIFEHCHPILARHWKDAQNKESRNNKGNTPLFTPWQAPLYLPLANYADVLLPMDHADIKGFTSEASKRNASPQQHRNGVEHMMSLHFLNHVLTARTRVQKHDKELRKQQKDSEGNDIGAADEDLQMRDQGYTRGKVLILLPTRGVCLTFMRQLLSCIGGGDDEDVEISHLDRFEGEFGVPPVEDDESEEDSQDDDGSEKRRHRMNRQRQKRTMEAKGPEWQALFGEDVNDSDDFKFGISFGIPQSAAASSSKKKQKKKKAGAKAEPSLYVNLYSDFYKSDIILASPLGLVGATNDFSSIDFLSSIEICWVGHSDVLLMQNWDHVTKALEALNQQPANHMEYETDFSRVRNYCLDGRASEFRQLIITSKFNEPLLAASFKKHAKSMAGAMKLRRRFSEHEATMSDVEFHGIKQIFQRVPCNSFVNQGDDRINFFAKHVLPQVSRLNQKHTMVFVPSYFDYVLLRNMLLELQYKRDAVSFVTINEYTEPSDVKRARSRFRSGKKKMLLYTGRAHYFMRHQIRGIKHLIFFGLPEHAEFYPGLANMMQMSNATGDDDEEMEDEHTPKSCLALITKYDTLALERIVGSVHCKNINQDDKSTFVFS